MDRVLTCADIFDSLSIAIFAVDTEMRIVFFNREAERITGFTQKEAMACKCFEIFRSHFCTDKCPMRRTLEGEKARIHATNNILTRENREIPIEVITSVMLDDEGNVIGALESFMEPLPHEEEALCPREDKMPLNPFPLIIGSNRKITKILEIIKVVAKTDAQILITGETGTGKDVVARAIHDISPRRSGPFVKVNCAAMPGELLESEFFGYRKGAFTDARTDKPGLFQMAEGGTIFLDEIGDLPLTLQAKLLQVLDEKVFYPLGSTEPVEVDVRVVASTNRDLNEMVSEMTFREDLYYRLNVIEIELPPLRERPEDIPQLVEHFLCSHTLSERENGPPIFDDAMKVLCAYHYPGNVRELKHIIEHACILSQGRSITPEMLPPRLFRDNGKKCREKDDLSTIDMEERDQIIDVLKRCSWNRGKASRCLGIDRSTLWRKMKRLDIA